MREQIALFNITSSHRTAHKRELIVQPDIQAANVDTYVCCGNMSFEY